MSARILVVDDEPALLDAISYALEQDGFEAETASDGERALELARTRSYDAVVLDVMLPTISGMEVCRRLRLESRVPILMLSAKGSEVDRVVGLELGADDYVTKPFSMHELLARVRAVLRRRELDRKGAPELVRRVGTLEIDFARHEVRVEGATVELTPGEFRLLELLSSEPGRAFDRRELVRHLWRSDFAGGERACDVHVVQLRRKLEVDPRRPRRIVTVRGVGYKLEPV